MWEVDPETRSKLLQVQKKDGNNTCCDCGAPSPQWASPKFGVFICLSCAGLHRGLGVHISFVRSVSMDTFKVGETARMDKGGNKAWRAFFDGHELTKLNGVSWDDCTINDRYGGEVGEEWKDRLTAAVEGKEYLPAERKKGRQEGDGGVEGGEVPLGRVKSGASSAQSSIRSSSPSAVPADGRVSRKAQNEAYFAKLGNQNAARPADLPPSQGGKYTGFGSDPSPAQGGGSSGEEAAMPSIDEFQHDPVKALTKSFGWFSTAVGKGAKTVNDGFIQPAAQKLAEADLAAQARLHAAQLGKNIQSGTQGAAGTIHRFVENQAAGPSRSSRSAASSTLEPDKRDFWESFGQDASGGGIGGRESKPSAIGTSAVRRGGGGEEFKGRKAKDYD